MNYALPESSLSRMAPFPAFWKSYDQRMKAKEKNKNKNKNWTWEQKQKTKNNTMEQRGEN